MTPTEKARRSDALYYETVSVTRRVLCDAIANREADLEDARAENAKLREQSERLFDKTLELATENSKLRELCKLCEREAENAKLRELVRFIMHQCNDGNPRCDECIDWNDGECVALLRMRELDVEVASGPRPND